MTDEFDSTNTSSVSTHKGVHPGESLSEWMDSVQMPTCPVLTEDLTVDVCVIGAGIAGLTTAYLLQQEGKKVCVLEDFEIGSGQSGRTTAHFTTALDDRYFNLEKLHGARGAKLAAESHSAAIKKVEEIVHTEQIDCDLMRLDGYLFVAETHTEETLFKELEATRRAGLLGVNLMSRAPMDAFETGPVLQFPRQMKLHPTKYMRGLSERILAGGGKIFTNTHITEVKGGDKAYAKSREGHLVMATSIVVATNTPINDLFAIHTKQAPYRTYVIAAQIPKNSVPQSLFWDTGDPYHYIRVEPGLQHDLLVVGGEDHKTGQSEKPSDCYYRLEKWMRDRFHMAQEIIYRWSGQVMEPVDGLAFLGHNPMDKNNVYIITGDSGNGMTHCTIGAMLITDQIMTRPNSWETLYNPSRISLRATATFLRENLNVAAQYKDWFQGRTFEDVEELPWGEGTVFRSGLRQVAAYKNHDGRLEFFSAACPHLSGVVHWNTAEKSWDCPCHGSRFDCHGQVIEGPAVENLQELKIENDHVDSVRDLQTLEKGGPENFLFPRGLPTI